MALAGGVAANLPLRQTVAERVGAPVRMPPIALCTDNAAMIGAAAYYRLSTSGGPAPVRRYLPELIDRVISGQINPGKVFDLRLPLEQVADGYQAMDERRAIKALLRV